MNSDIENNNIQYFMPYEYIYGNRESSPSRSDRSMKVNSIVSTTRNFLRNVLYTNVVNVTTFGPQQQLLTPIVFFSDADMFSPRLSQLQQELEEVKVKLRSLMKTHLRTRRFHLITDIVYLRQNVTLLNSIRSTSIESVSLYNTKNAVRYKLRKHMVRFTRRVNRRTDIS